MCHQPEKTHFCNECHHGSDDRLRVQAERAVGQPAPDGGRQVGREVVHRQVPHHEVLRRLPHRQEGRSRIAQAALLGPSGRHRPSPSTVRRPRQPSAKHALAAQESIESCEICHGAGGTEREVLQELPQAMRCRTRRSSRSSTPRPDGRTPRRVSDCHTLPRDLQQLPPHRLVVHEAVDQGPWCIGGQERCGQAASRSATRRTSA